MKQKILLQEKKGNDLMSEKTCKYLNYVEYLFILASTVTGCVLISAFASLVCGITAAIKKYKSIIKEKKCC